MAEQADVGCLGSHLAAANCFYCGAFYKLYARVRVLLLTSRVDDGCVGRCSSGPGQPTPATAAPWTSSTRWAARPARANNKLAGLQEQQLLVGSTGSCWLAQALQLNCWSKRRNRPPQLPLLATQIKSRHIARVLMPTQSLNGWQLLTLQSRQAESVIVTTQQKKLAAASSELLVLIVWLPLGLVRWVSNVYGVGLRRCRARPLERVTLSYFRGSH